MMWSISSEAVKSLREAPLLDRKDPPRPLSKWLILWLLQTKSQLFKKIYASASGR